MACGDFLWMNKIIEQTNIDYLGIDIVEELISENKNKYKKIFKTLIDSDENISEIESNDNNSLSSE